MRCLGLFFVVVGDVTVTFIYLVVVAAAVDSLFVGNSSVTNGKFFVSKFNGDALNDLFGDLTGLLTALLID